MSVITAFFFGPESYNIWNNYISDLGSFNYTPLPFILDFIAMSTALLLIPIFIFFTRLLYKNPKEEIYGFWRIFYILMRVIIVIGFIFLILAVIGLFGIGLFSEDRTTELGLHIFFSYIVFGAFSFSAIFIGVVILLKKTPFFRPIGLFMIFSTPSMGILFIINPHFFTREFIEWMLFISIVIWLLPINFIIQKKVKK